MTSFLYRIIYCSSRPPLSNRGFILTHPKPRSLPLSNPSSLVHPARRHPPPNVRERRPESLRLSQAPARFRRVQSRHSAVVCSRATVLYLAATVVFVRERWRNVLIEGETKQREKKRERERERERVKRGGSEASGSHAFDVPARRGLPRSQGRSLDLV